MKTEFTKELDIFVNEMKTIFKDEGAFCSDVDEEFEGSDYLESVTRVMGGGSENCENKGVLKVNFDNIISIIENKKDKTGEKDKIIIASEEIKKASACGKSALGLRGKISGNQFFKFIHCYRWYCQKCGSKGGRMNKRRFSSIFRSLESEYKLFQKTAIKPLKIDEGVFDLRQMVFTVPLELRKYFMTKKAISSLNRIASRVSLKNFPGVPSFRYFHGFGDKKKEVYAPHVNIHCFEFEKKNLYLSADELKKIKQDYFEGLRGFISAVHGVVIPQALAESLDVHYSYVESDKLYERKIWNDEEKKYNHLKVEGYKLILHRIMYMSRPCPGFVNFDAIKNDKKLIKLFVCSMKGFIYISRCGSWLCKKDNILREETKELVSLAGEALAVDRDSEGNILYISRAEFDLKYRFNDYQELSDGFYKIHSPEKKDKKKKKNKNGVLL